MKEIRKKVKETLIAQGGVIYNFNINNLVARYGCRVCAIQNAIDYFRYSPQQANFREAHNIH